MFFLLALAIIMPVANAIAETRSEEGAKLAKEEQELRHELQQNAALIRAYNNYKERSMEQERELEQYNRNEEILLNGISRVQRDRNIVEARANMEYYENQIEADEWWIENTADPEKRGHYEQQKKEHEHFRDVAEDAYNEARYQPVNWGQFTGEMVSGFVSGRIYAQYQGLAKLGSLLLGEEELERNREALRKFFCDVLHLPTVQCYSSQLCAAFPDNLQRDSTLITRTAANNMLSAAHIEATKSEPITTAVNNRQKIERLYIATFAVYNSLSAAIDFSVELLGEGEVYIWVPAQQINAGSTYSKSKTSPLTSYLEKDYNSICITFNPGITDFRGRTRTRLCSPIVQTGG